MPEVKYYNNGKVCTNILFRWRIGSLSITSAAFQLYILIILGNEKQATGNVLGLLILRCLEFAVALICLVSNPKHSLTYHIIRKQMCRLILLFMRVRLGINHRIVKIQSEIVQKLTVVLSFPIV